MNAPKLQFLLCLFLLLAPLSCRQDEENPTPDQEILNAVADKTQVPPYALVALTIKEKTLQQGSYTAQFGSESIQLTRLSDSTYAFGVPDLAAGRHQLISQTESGAIKLEFVIEEKAHIEDPKVYLNEFASLNLEGVSMQLDSLVAKGEITNQEADDRLLLVLQKQQETEQRIAAASAEEQRVAAYFIAANRQLLDEVKVLLASLASAQSNEGGRLLFEDSDIIRNTRILTRAVAKIGVMVAGPALVLSAAGVWPAAGAVVGWAIFRDQIWQQMTIIVGATQNVLSEHFIPVANSIASEVSREAAAERFINGIAREISVSIKYRNIQASDAGSAYEAVREFVQTYLATKQLLASLSELPSLPGFKPLSEKGNEVDYSKLSVAVIQNGKVSGGLLFENNVYLLKFSMQEVDEQNFRYQLTYVPQGVPPFVKEVDAVLEPVTYQVSKANGDDQTGLPGEELENPLVVQVLDAEGRPVQGFQVSWSIVSGGGTVSGASVTDVQGQASAKMQLGEYEGQHQIAVVVRDVNGQDIKGGRLEFSALAKYDFRLFNIFGNNQQAALGTTLKDSLAVRLVDKTAIPIKGKHISWRVLEGGGSISSSSQITDSQGASRVRWTLGTSGTQKVEASFKDSEGNHVEGSPTVFTANASRVTVTSYSLRGWACINCDCDNTFYRRGNAIFRITFNVPPNPAAHIGQKTYWDGGSGEGTLRISDLRKINDTTYEFNMGFCWGGPTGDLYHEVHYIETNGSISNKIKIFIPRPY